MTKSSDKLKSMKKLTRPRPRHMIAAIAALSFVIVATSLVLFFAVGPLRQSQDLRQQASTTSEQPKIFLEGPSGRTETNQQASISIYANTGDQRISAFQFEGLLDTSSIVTDSLQITGGASADYTTIVKNGNTATVATINVAKDPAPALEGEKVPVFKPSDRELLATISFTTKNLGGAVQLESTTNSAIINSTGATVASSVQPLAFLIFDPNDDGVVCAADTFTCDDDSVVGRDPTRDCAFICPTPTPTPTPSPTPTTDPGTGGVTVKSCNEICSSNAECAVNLACSDGRCRLATNTGSSTCQPNTTSDRGTSNCDQYCADNTECDAGYSCWYNRCRNPLNIESSSCAPLTASQQNAIAVSCNQSCATNANCATNLRCYYGVCRLANNPTHTTCALPSRDTSNQLAKGATPTFTPKPSPDKTGTESGTTATPSATPRVTPTPIAMVDDDSTDDSALAALGKWLKDFWQNGQRTQVFIAVGFGILMLIGLIALLFSLLSPQPKAKKITTPTVKIPPTPMPPPPTLTR